MLSLLSSNYSIVQLNYKLEEKEEVIESIVSVVWRLLSLLSSLLMEVRRRRVRILIMMTLINTNHIPIQIVMLLTKYFDKSHLLFDNICASLDWKQYGNRLSVVIVVVVMKL
jgi:hypothetical protein